MLDAHLMNGTTVEMKNHKRLHSQTIKNEMSVLTIMIMYVFQTK